MTTGDTTGPGRPPRVGFVLEQTLGHITHAQNLRRLIDSGSGIVPTFAPIEFDTSGIAARLPGVRNWTVRAGWRARQAVRRMRREGPVDALFIHTQVPAMLIPDIVRRIPTVVSLDATPRQYDDLGRFYDHRRGNRLAEALKASVHRQGFRRAARIVTWSEWSKAGLVDDYGVPADKVVVIPPGVDVEMWSAHGDSVTGDVDRPFRVLFVGGDLERKGGTVLLDAVGRLRADGVDVEADLVTRDEVAPRPGVTIHRGVVPNSPELIALYQAADVFCLPTFGDCLPMVLSEAGARGMPLVSTDVGAIDEIVRDGETGLLVPPGDPRALATALARLATDRGLRARLGAGARTAVLADFDARANAARLVEVLRQIAG